MMEDECGCGNPDCTTDAMRLDLARLLESVKKLKAQATARRLVREEVTTVLATGAVGGRLEERVLSSISLDGEVPTESLSTNDDERLASVVTPKLLETLDTVLNIKRIKDGNESHRTQTDSPEVLTEPSQNAIIVTSAQLHDRRAAARVETSAVGSEAIPVAAANRGRYSPLPEPSSRQRLAVGAGGSSREGLYSPLPGPSSRQRLAVGAGGSSRGRYSPLPGPSSRQRLAVGAGGSSRERLYQTLQRAMFSWTNLPNNAVGASTVRRSADLSCDEFSKILCSICFHDMFGNDGNTKCSMSCLSCGHVFCTDCILKWSSLKSCCPLCFKKILLKDIIKLFPTPATEHGKSGERVKIRATLKSPAQVSCREIIPGKCYICDRQMCYHLRDVNFSTSVLPCGHVFCENCIVQWQREKRKCPLCLAIVSPRDIKPLFF